MGFYPIQPSFLAGELSPKLYGRTDLPLYKHGVQYSENFHHTPQGMLRMRRGTKYVADAHQSTGNVRLIPFQSPSPDGTDYVLEFGAGYVRLLSKTGDVIQQGIVNTQLIVNNTFAGGMTSWTKSIAYYSVYTPNGTGTSCLMELYEAPTPDPSIHYVPADNNTVPSIRQQVTVVTPGNYNLTFTAGTLTGNGNLVGVVVQVGTTVGAHDIYGPTVVAPGAAFSTLLTGLSATTYWVQFTMNYTVVPRPGPNDNHCSVILPALTFNSGSGPNLITGLPWTDTQVQQLQYVQDQQEGMFVVHKNMAPQKITFVASSGVLACAAVTFTAPPADWVAGNYPGAVEIFQGRLWLGGSPDKPNTLWASVQGNYYDFTVPGTVLTTSSFVCTFGTKGRIQWIRGKQQLLVGTDLHENIIVSATGVVSAVDAQLVRESGYGSMYLQPCDVGDQVLFVGVDKIKLRALNFNFETQAYIAREVTFNADHITKQGIQAVAYARDPDSIVYVLLSSGQMVMCTYDRLQEVTAWSRWTTTGTVLSMCAARDTSTTSIWVAVNRNGVTEIEYIPSFDAETPFFLDCATVSTPTIFSTSGVQYARLPVAATTLAGTLVRVVIDGVDCGIGTVGGVVSGNVDVPYPTGSGIQGAAGIVYPIAKVTSLPLNEGVMYGSAQGQKKARNNVFLRMITESAPLVNGYRVQAPPFTWIDDFKNRLYQTDWKTSNLGWDRYARFDIVADIPLQTDICAIFGDAEVSQL